MTHAENIDADLDAIIADQFPNAKEITINVDEIPTRPSVPKPVEKVGEVKLYGANLKYPSYNFQMEQVLYDKSKYFQFVAIILHPLDETERVYNMFFHIKS
jgi:hypothetical protein